MAVNNLFFRHGICYVAIGVPRFFWHENLFWKNSFFSLYTIDKPCRYCIIEAYETQHKETTMTTAMTINGFTFKLCNGEKSFSERYYQATNGTIVLTSKSLNYLVKKVKKIS